MEAEVVTQDSDSMEEGLPNNRESSPQQKKLTTTTEKADHTTRKANPAAQL